jgi:hypothetical protein
MFGPHLAWTEVFPRRNPALSTMSSWMRLAVWRSSTSDARNTDSSLLGLNSREVRRTRAGRSRLPFLRRT